MDSYKVALKDLSEDQKSAMQKMIRDVVYTAFGHVDWGETMKDFADHHPPAEYCFCLDRDDVVEVFEFLLEGLFNAENKEAKDHVERLIKAELEYAVEKMIDNEKSEQLN